MENEINLGFYVEILLATRRYNVPKLTKFLAPLWKYDVIIIVFTSSMILLML